MVCRNIGAPLLSVLIAAIGFGYGCRRQCPDAPQVLMPSAGSSSPASASATSLKPSFSTRCPIPSASTVYGTSTDGRLNASACNAWPKRQGEPETLSRLEIAKACVVLGACAKELLALAAADDDRIAEDSATATVACPRIALWFEERAIPFGPFGERFPYLARSILKEADSCSAAPRQLLKRPDGLECQEVGCSEDDPKEPTQAFSCTGTKAQRSKKGQP